MVEEAMQGRNTLERVERSATYELNISSYPGAATRTVLIGGPLSTTEPLRDRRVSMRWIYASISSAERRQG